MGSNAPLTRRRPKRFTPHYPELPQPIPSSSFSPRLDQTTPYRKSDKASTLNEILQDTPSPLRELERGWKETRRKRLGTVLLSDGNLSQDDTIDSGEALMVRANVDQDRRSRNNVNVRFITSSSSALLTPPDTPPASPKFPASSIPNRKKDQQASSRAKGNIPTRLRQHSIISSSYSPVPPQPATIPQPRKHTIKPILSHPLPPTFRPVRIQKNKKDTIYIPSHSTRYEVILNLVGGQTIKVSRGGRTVEFNSGKGERKGQGRILDISEVEKWSNEDKRDWENLAGAVEGFKRITPRIKMFHPLGHLSITCSSPPDIILSFQIQLESLDTNTPLRSTDSSSRASHGIQDVRPRARARMVYSRFIRELKIDLACAIPLNRERLRTRRILLVTRHLDDDCTMGRQNGESMTLGDILHWLGVASDPGEWREEEKEGVRRLWDLRNEWLRWDDR